MAVDETDFIWLNNSFVPWKEAKVHFLTHALHYGTSVFEGIRCYNTQKGPAVFRLKEHVARLFNSAKAINMKIPFTEQELIDAIIETIKKNKCKECYIRPLAFYSYDKMGLNINGLKVDVGIAVWPWKSYFGKDGVEKGIEAKISSWIRAPNNIMPTNAKVSGNYVASALAKVDAINSGYQEAILLDINGNIAEASVENIFIVKDNCLITPPLKHILAGITRDSVLKLAKDLGIKTVEKFFKEKELFSADEAFVTGTAAELTPVVKINEKMIGNGLPGTLTKKLQEKFSGIVRGKDSTYFDWLALVK